MLFNSFGYKAEGQTHIHNYTKVDSRQNMELGQRVNLRMRRKTVTTAYFFHIPLQQFSIQPSK